MTEDRIARARERLRDLKSDMAPYERKDETIIRLKRQRNEAVKIAEEALALTTGDAVEAERERCAKIADEEISARREDQKRDPLDNFTRGQLNTALRIAAAIRKAPA